MVCSSLAGCFEERGERHTSAHIQPNLRRSNELLCNHPVVAAVRIEYDGGKKEPYRVSVYRFFGQLAGDGSVTDPTG